MQTNLAKYRQVQTNLAGSTERADLNAQAEDELTRLYAKREQLNVELRRAQPAGGATSGELFGLAFRHLCEGTSRTWAATDGRSGQRPNASG